MSALPSPIRIRHVWTATHQAPGRDIFAKSVDRGKFKPLSQRHLSAFAVLRLIANSNLVGWTTGSSAGFAPLVVLLLIQSCVNLFVIAEHVLGSIHDGRFPVFVAI
jgi:hypothetical protein